MIEVSHLQKQVDDRLGYAQVSARIVAEVHHERFDPGIEEIAEMLRERLVSGGCERVESDVADAAVDYSTRHQRIDHLRGLEHVPQFCAVAPHHD